MRRWAIVALPFVAALALGAGACGIEPDLDATVVIRYSAFEPEVLTVPAGVPVTITLRNDDPIDHEWIVGTAEVHEAHRTGTEPYHATRPAEVTIPALSTRTTTLIFDEPGDFAYICHLPGHEDYGMVGNVRVVEA